LKRKKMGPRKLAMKGGFGSFRQRGGGKENSQKRDSQGAHVGWRGKCWGDFTLEENVAMRTDFGPEKNYLRGKNFEGVMRTALILVSKKGPSSQD